MRQLRRMILQVCARCVGRRRLPPRRRRRYVRAYIGFGSLDRTYRRATCVWSNAVSVRLGHVDVRQDVGGVAWFGDVRSHAVFALNTHCLCIAHSTSRSNRQNVSKIARFATRVVVPGPKWILFPRELNRKVSCCIHTARQHSSGSNVVQLRGHNSKLGSP